MNEGILNTAINQIQGIEDNPELRENLIKDFYYVLDVVISHDGEASLEDLNKKAKEYNSIQEAVKDKLEQSNTADNYKFVAQTPEGMLAKYADVIAYLGGDIRDGFNLGIFHAFNEDYLEIFGKIISSEAVTSREKAIELAKNKISTLQFENLKSAYAQIKEHDFSDEKNINEENDGTIKMIKNIMKDIKKEEINTYVLSYKNINDMDSFRMKSDNEDKLTQDEKENQKEEVKRRYERLEKLKEESEEKVNSIVQEHINRYIKKYVEDRKDKFTKANADRLKADCEKIINGVDYVLYSNTKLVRDVTNIVQEYFINDLIKNSQNQKTPQMSAYATSLYLQAKKWGYENYVGGVKTKYQEELLPRNVESIVEYCSKEIQKTKIVETILNSIPIDEIPEKFRKYLPAEKKNKEILEEKEIENIIKDITGKATIRGRYTCKDKGKIREFDIINKIKHSIKKCRGNFPSKYIETMKAIENQVNRKYNIAMDKDRKWETNREYENNIEAELGTELENLRKYLRTKYPQIYIETKDAEKIKEIEELKKKIIIKAVDNERKKIEEKLTYQLVIDYISGMTDTGIKDLAEKLGYMKPEEFDKAMQYRGQGVSKTVQALVKSHSENSIGNQTGDPTEGRI